MQTKDRGMNYEASRIFSTQGDYLARIKMKYTPK